MTRTRVVVTGLGGLCALGTTAPEIWAAMRSGTCGLRPMTFEHPLIKTRIGGEVPPFDDSALDSRQKAAMARYAVLAVLAAREAMAQAGLAEGGFDPARAGAVVGVGVFGSDAIDDAYQDVFVRDKRRPSIFTVPRAMPSSPSAQVSMLEGLRGPVFGVTSACASANHAFSTAADLLRLGRADVMLAGAADTPLQFGSLKAWEAMRVLARDGCRPFSNDRDGLVLAEGAGIVVLETLEHATARGAEILAELVGTGLSGDAGDIVSPSEQGMIDAMRACLRDADLSPEAVDYVNAHGTATRLNDRTETLALRQVFGEHVSRLSISATKSMHGHCLGASGAIELIACVNAIRDGIVPPTIGLREPDPECDLDYTVDVARERRVDVAISNSFGFGGMNAVVALRRMG